jgi:hypothetical protein
VHQWALSIDSYFLSIINSSPDDPHLEHSFHANTFFYWHLNEFMGHIYYTDDDSEILTVVVSTLTKISMALNDIPNPQRDFLFYTASYYAKSLSTAISRPRQPKIVSVIPTLLQALRNYKAHLGEGILSLEEILEIPSFSNAVWWEFLKLETKPTSLYGSNSEKMGANLSLLSLSLRKSKTKDNISDGIHAPSTPYAEGDKK